MLYTHADKKQCTKINGSTWKNVLTPGAYDSSQSNLSTVLPLKQCVLFKNTFNALMYMIILKCILGHKKWFSDHFWIGIENDCQFRKPGCLSFVSCLLYISILEYDRLHHHLGCLCYPSSPFVIPFTYPSSLSARCLILPHISDKVKTVTNFLFK